MLITSMIIGFFSAIILSLVLIVGGNKKDVKLSDYVDSSYIDNYDDEDLSHEEELENLYQATVFLGREKRDVFHFIEKHIEGKTSDKESNKSNKFNNRAKSSLDGISKENLSDVSFVNNTRDEFDNINIPKADQSINSNYSWENEYNEMLSSHNNN